MFSSYFRNYEIFTLKRLFNAALIEHGNHGKLKRSSHVDEVKGRIDSFISILDEKMPDNDEVRPYIFVVLMLGELQLFYDDLDTP